MPRRQSLVVIGNGMAAMRTVEELQKLAPDLYDITVFGAEPHGNYNRILLSPLLSGEKKVDDIMLHPHAWYHAHGITLHAGDPAVRIDRRRRMVHSQAGVEVAYDRLLLATGSTPFIIPVPGHDLPGVMAFRTIDDVHHMLAAARVHRHAVVIGGGLLGLEAANGLLRQGMQVTVVHVSASLMNQQLDAPASALLQMALEAKGIRFLLDAHTSEIVGDTTAEKRVRAVRLKDGRDIPADLVVMAAGVRPNMALAQQAGLQCERAILVDDTLQTYDPRIYAVGECVQHRRTTFGLVTPIWEQARVCGAHLAARRSPLHPAGHRHQAQGQRRRPVFGRQFCDRRGIEDLVLRDPGRGIYKRLVLQNQRLLGAVLYGDVKDGPWYFDLIRDGSDISAHAFRACCSARRCVQRQRKHEHASDLISADRVIGAHTCPYCGVGCGVKASLQEDGSVKVAGDEQHPANLGRLCVKGSALGETVALDGRMLYPQLRSRDDGTTRRVTWDSAIDKVAQGFADIIAEHGPDAVAFYISGQVLTEDYYIANKLMKGYIGSANIDTNSRLCMSSAVAGHKRAFGEDLVPVCYEDLELADLIILVGSNTAWCHPILFQRIARIKDSRPQMKLVVLDPRRTATCELADLHLPLKPGSDVALFNGLLNYLAQQNVIDSSFVTAHTNGMQAALDAAGSADLQATATACGLASADLLAFYALFAANPKTITAFSQGVNQSSSGTDKVNSIINCHLLTGRIGKPGMGPFSITGQPNAMGGREAGGLANMLAAHMDLDNPLQHDIVRTFWDAPRLAVRPGLKTLDLFHAIEQGRVKAVWIIATNPMVSMPDADQVRRALQACELVVVSDIMQDTDTNALADVLLPALGWGEKDGSVTNSERRISRQRAFLSAPGEARADWQVLCAVARRMGFPGFDFTHAHQVFDEHARLSRFREWQRQQRKPASIQSGWVVRPGASRLRCLATSAVAVAAPC